MMGESYGILNLNNNAKYNIEDAIEPNGITGFHLHKVDYHYTYYNQLHYLKVIHFLDL